MDLGGRWRANEADDELRRALPDPAYDDRGWPEIRVPGQWRSTPEFADSEGPLFYRHRFVGRGGGRDRMWLVFDGIFYQADVWLDGSYLGDSEGYFAPHSFEVTDHLRRGDEHLLAVEVACSPERDRRNKHNLTGVFQDWDCLDPTWNPGGIWAPVRVERSGPVRLRSLRVLCREASEERAAIEIEAHLDSDAGRIVEVTTTAQREGVDGAPVTTTTSTPTLAAGDNRVRWRVTIERPALWWPHALGEQPLYRVDVGVTVDGERSDTRTLSTGLRQIGMQRFVTTVNGERLFLKGANIGPSRRAISDVTLADVTTDLSLACDAGLDLVRVHGHVASPDLYDRADRLGLLLWQDLPLQWRYGPVRRQAAAQARQLVDLLGHHPSIAVWCGHNEPLGPVRSGQAKLAPAGIVRRASRQALPDVGALRLDRSVRRALERSDGSRSVVAHSGVLPHPAGGTDTHLYPGWSEGERDLPGLFARWPALARFVGEFGAQAVPQSAAFMEPDRWPDLDWSRLEASYGLEKAALDRWTPPGEHPTFRSWRDATQEHQADVVRRCVETFRRLKYRPTGGFSVFFLADAQPAISWSLVDHERVPKPGFAALKEACAPVIIVADELAPAYQRGAPLDVTLHVVSDRRAPITAMMATATLSWPEGERTWRFGGDVGADTCARIGRITTTVPPDSQRGELRLELRLTWDDPTGADGQGAVGNLYRSTVSD